MKISFAPGQIYFLENPEHGTLEATLEIVSENNQSLAFTLKHPIMIRSRRGDGFYLTHGLAISYEDNVFSDIFTGQKWTIHETEPS